MNTQEKALYSIAVQAKYLLLSDNVKDATPEIMDLCELVERYEERFGELEPELKPHNKKPWYASYTKR